MPGTPAFTLQEASEADFEALLALRLRAMRESLERLGRYDPARARKRLAATFAPEHTQHIVMDVDGAPQRVGFIVLKRLTQALRIDHLYVDEPFQGRGIGAAVLQWVARQADAGHQRVELCALKHSRANAFYMRHGFVAVGQGDWDIDYVRMPESTATRAVKALWAALEARDWPAARRLLRADVQATWWASGERFINADAFIDANARYPEGWHIVLIEVARLSDGRAMSVVRVDHPPQAFFATSIFRVDDGLIVTLDEFWATVEPPPAWRDALVGVQRIAPQDDPRAHAPVVPV